MTTVKIAHCPLHGPSWRPALGRRAFRTRAHSIGWTEGYRAWPWLSKHTGRYRHYTAAGTRQDSRGRRVGWDVIISVRKDCPVVAHGSFKLAPELNVRPNGNKYHPERHAVWVCYTTPDNIRVLDIRWHPQPGPLRHPAKVLPCYRRSVTTVTGVTRDLRGRYKPNLIVGGGDLQVGTLGRWIGPNRLYNRLGMTAQHRGVDWLAWTRTWRATGAWRINARAIAKGIDHPWLVRVLQPTQGAPS